MIQEALRQKKAYYDFFGIAPDASDVHHPLHGVTQFKRLFTDEILCFPKAYGIVLQPGVYRILRAVRYFRNI